MAYGNNFVVVVKTKGKILKDLDGTVQLPFGSDYSLVLKNKDSRKAVVNIEVDGDDALGGHQVIVPANDSVEIEGFLHGNTVKNKFRFIEKTSQISNYRGDRLDDGLVRVEFRFEQPLPQPVIRTLPPYWYNTVWTSTLLGDTVRPINQNPDAIYSCNVGNNTTRAAKCTYSTDGITVPGSETNQKFSSGYTNTLETHSHVITMKLKGISSRGNKVVKPVVFERKPCVTCGQINKSSKRFCSNCGTFIHNV